MVRLKVDHQIKTVNRDKFQFLYGAIKSFLIAEIARVTKQFQFLYGAIKSYNR